MEKSREVIEVLNDLVMINNDRIRWLPACYKRIKTG